MNLKAEVEADATLFGSAIHKALEHWYCLPSAERELTKSQAENADILIASPSSMHSGALESLRQFVLKAQPLATLDSTDKRSIENGLKILKAYFKQYKDDGLEIMLDSNNEPMVEKQLEAVLYEDDQIQIIYFGTVDAIMKNIHSNLSMIADHKTTASLGSQFYNRIKPNHQYTGYVWLAQQALGLDTNLFMVNGIQVAKTKSEFARQVTDRSPEDIQEFKDAVIGGVRTYLNAMNTGIWPQFAPNPCSNYGACQFLPVCSSPANLRKTIIMSNFKTTKGAME